MQRIKKILRIVRLIFKINWIKTLYINFKTQNIKDAIKLPILIYGKLKIKSLRGNIIFKCPISFGLLQMGKNLDDFSTAYLPITLNINGALDVYGSSIISGGSTITIWKGCITLGKYTTIGSGCNIKCYTKIQINDFSRIVAGCFLMDTNVHFVRNGNSNSVSNIYGEIYIGKYCWLNSGTIVTKGTKLPDYSIAARNSYLNKDYSLEVEKGAFLVGSPAKIKSTNLQRIYGFKLEKELKGHFLSDENLTEIPLKEIIENDEDFKPFFKVI